jgi:uncharacterized membrane protein
MRPDRRPSLVLPGLLLGVGLGGFVDGIVLHQILQWHHMISETDPPTTLAGLEANTVADGLFHAATWIAVVAGVALLWRRLRYGRPDAGLPWRVLIGLLLAGWGLFNVVEGLVDHHLLGVHHVRSGPDQTLYDVAFLVFGAALLAGGWALYRRAAGSLALGDAEGGPAAVGQPGRLGDPR